MKAAKLFARDEKKRKRAGWGSMAFIAPEFDEPKTKEEKLAMKLLIDHFGERMFMVHVYDVLEALEKAILIGEQNG